MTAAENGSSIRAVSAAPAAIMQRLCLIVALTGGACASARAQDRFYFTYSGSGISVGGALVSALIGRPAPTELILLSALAHERSKEMPLSEADYTKAVRSSLDPGVGLSYVRFLQRRGKIEAARNFLIELSERWPRNSNVLTVLAQVELLRSDWTAAQAAAKSIRNVGDPRGIAFQIEGAALVGQGKVDEAIALFQRAAAASPSAAQPMALLVTALVRAHKIDRAVAVLASALQEDPDNAAAHVLMGAIQIAGGAPDRALHSFQQAIAAQPANVAGYQALARLYVGENKFDDAIAVIRSGLRTLPENMTLHLALAGVLERTGQYEAAIAGYETMLSKAPDSLVVRNNLASLLSDRRSDEASLARAQSLAAGLPASQVPQFMDTLGWVSYRRGDFKDSVSLLTKAAAALPDSAIVRYHLGMGYLANKQAAEAAEQLKAALVLAPDRELEEKIRDAMRKLPN